jgi:glycosyltransferase involved in cell wall biosynthesis
LRLHEPKVSGGPTDNCGTLLLLAPSTGFGGGIERVAEVVARAWPGPVIRLNLYRSGRESVPAGNRARQARFSVQAVAAALRSRPDFVFCLHAGLLPVAAAAARGSGARLAVWAHGDEVWLPPAAAKLALWRGVDIVLSSSTFTAARVVEAARVADERVHPMHLPVAPAFESERPPESDGGGPRLLSVGRVSRQSRYKGYYEIAGCLPAVLREVPDATWQIAGSGDDVEALLGHCEALGLGRDTVTVSSGLDDRSLAAAYADATVFVLPSTVSIGKRTALGEGFGMVYAEAGMLGVPSIASTRGGGALDFVEHERTGLTVPPEDGDALRAAIVRILTDGALRDRLGGEALARARNMHTFAVFEAEFRDTLRI